MKKIPHERVSGFAQYHTYAATYVEAGKTTIRDTCSIDLSIGWEKKRLLHHVPITGSMAYETFQSNAEDMYPSDLGDGFVSYTEEQCLLMHLCYQLASTCHTADESPDVDETRKQAQLLMNLMHCCHNSSNINKNTAAVLERSTSDQSFASCHSTPSTKMKRDRFSFTCPSLSLENFTCSSYFRDVEREVSGMYSQFEPAHYGLSQPAHLLLGRSLKVDDSDALRLSADAMARNVLQSFQKAMHWRIHAWIFVLSKKIVRYERQMLASGATLEDLATLLHTPEARLIVALQNLAQDRGFTAESAITSFEVLSQRIEDYEEDAHGRSCVVGTSSTQSTSSSSSSSSDEITSLSDHSANTLGSRSLDTYSYVVAHELRFCCTVHLQTLVGFTEIALTVPGTVAGVFESSEADPSAQFKSVTVDLDTNALASLIDKACRAVVRSSVEKVITQLPMEQTASSKESLEDEIDVKVNVGHGDEADIATTPEVSSFNLSSPPPPPPAATTGLNDEAVPTTTTGTKSAFVTPGPHHSDDLYHTTTPTTNILIPISDDLKSIRTKSNDTPRRISPQPTTTTAATTNLTDRRSYLRTGSTNSDDSLLSVVNVPLVSSTRASSSSSLKRRTPPPLSLDDATTAEAADHHKTSAQFLRQRRSLPLISPPGGSQNTIQFYHNVPDNGPSLPMLVEAACQVASQSHGSFGP